MADQSELKHGLKAISTPREAVQAMIDAGAVFAVQRRGDALGVSFTYSMKADGDRDRARAILSDVKARPPAFLAAFRCLVQQVAGEPDVDQ